MNKITVPQFLKEFSPDLWGNFEKTSNELIQDQEKLIWGYYSFIDIERLNIDSLRFLAQQLGIPNLLYDITVKADILLALQFYIFDSKNRGQRIFYQNLIDVLVYIQIKRKLSDTNKEAFKEAVLTDKVKGGRFYSLSALSVDLSKRPLRYRSGGNIRRSFYDIVLQWHEVYDRFSELSVSSLSSSEFNSQLLLFECYLESIYQSYIYRLPSVYRKKYDATKDIDGVIDKDIENLMKDNTINVSKFLDRNITEADFNDSFTLKHLFKILYTIFRNIENSENVILRNFATVFRIYILNSFFLSVYPSYLSTFGGSNVVVSNNVNIHVAKNLFLRNIKERFDGTSYTAIYTEAKNYMDNEFLNDVNELFNDDGIRSAYLDVNVRFLEGA